MSNEALLDAPSAEAKSDPVCEKCQTPLRVKEMSVCPRCGYYPSLGIFVEVAAWESEMYDPDAAATKPQPSHLDVWLGLIPGWAWCLFATSLAVVLASVAVRLLTEPPFRTTWSVTQMVGGLAIAMFCHVAAFVWMLSTEYDLGVTDVVVRPLKIWIRICSELPRRFWLLNIEVASLTAALSAALIIGGIPYERLWDWGFKAPPKQNLMGAILDQAKNAKGNDDGLEEAVQDFAGTADGAADQNDKNDSQATPRLKDDCVIIGYTPRQDGKVVQLWLASEFRGKLIFVGRVTPRLPEAEVQELLAKLGESHTPRPFVSASGESQWVRPTLTCRVNYAKRDPSGRFVDMAWDELLGEVKLP